jgi:uncharacterized cupin superfamily protein
MRTFETARTNFEQVGPITVARWEQYRIGADVMPFGAMWYSVPPGTSSVRDCHPELELSIVLTGTAHVEIGDTLTEVGAGNAFLLDSEEAHVVHNRTSDQPVLIFSGYWMPLDAGVRPAPPT